MRAIVGVDGSRSSRQALDLFLKLRFEPCEVVLVHAIESALPDGSFPEFPSGHPLGDAMRDNVATGSRILRQAHARAMAYGIDAGTELLYGEPAKMLMAAAEREEADLIVVGSNRRPPLDDFLLGSTARTLLHDAPQHLLVGRRPVTRSQKLVAVLAADHRKEPQRVASEVLSLCPKGIGKLGVLTVSPLGLDDLERVGDLPVAVPQAAEWIEGGLKTENTHLAERLSTLGARCEPIVVDGEMPACAIVMAANRLEADLVIVGAERHGFLDRHLRRSVSEGLLANDQRGLLVLRPERRDHHE